MLIRFEVSNFRSIRDPVELSMVAVDEDRLEVRSVPSLAVSLLPVTAIYGPNASGKSNVLAAIDWFRGAVRDSLRFWDDGIPLQPFAFGGAGLPSEFTVESVIAGVRFEYVLEVDAEAIRYEGLFHYPEKKRRRIFEREGSELTLQRGLGNLSGIRELLTDRALALSIARRFDEPLVSNFVYDILRVQILGNQTLHRFGRGMVPGSSTRRWFEDQVDSGQAVLPGLEGIVGSAEADRAEALAMLRMADLGIDDVIVDKQMDDVPGRERTRVRLVHRTADGRMPLAFSSESDGTRAWFGLIGPVLTALKEGLLVVFDELDANLHPMLSAQLIRLFHDPATNPRGAQLIFSSNDTSLLNHLNRDQVWLTEKLDDGATRLGALAEFAGERVRKSQNLEKAYLHGRFGALPDVDRTEILRALGLIG